MIALRACFPALLLSCWLAGTALADIAYETEIAGAPNKTLAAALKENSQLVKLQDRPPPSDAALRRRAEDDRPTLLRIMHDGGYWAARIDVAIDAAAHPTKVTLRVDPGPLYHLTKLVFVTPQGGTPPLVAGFVPETFGLTLGGAARAAPVIAAEGKIVAALGERGYPFAKVTERRVVIDDAARSMAVTYTVEAGTQARFGALAIDGLKSLDPGYVERRVTWRRGAPYDERKVAATRKALIDSNLFSLVTVGHAEGPAPDGTVPMRITLSERLPRSIGAGVEYSTNYGLGASAFWEHRNLFGNAEKLRVTTIFAQSQLDLSVGFRRPDLGAAGQDLVVTGELADESPVAYTSRRLRVLAGLERRLGTILTLGAGTAYEHGNVTAHNITQHYQLIGLPLYLRRDDTDDLLNPVRGDREAIETTPYESIDGSGLSFLSSRLSGSLYQPVGEGDDYVLAGFARLGSIIGASRDRLPADKRLYAGGGGSIRGYGYQLVGPLDIGNKPLGGRSSLEFGGELRVKITQSLGLAPFLEAGDVYTTSLPRPTGRLFYGTGIGLRYYTSVGPIRLDLATPLSRRSVDSPIQVYISLGQAF
ncbi:MAG: BamA/TamA family outer membrane protein [Alphaproteobacteria bacterium]|nr:BamA/TamA family outer membrane protein [Alphaproteobacteria bacterium]